METKSQKLKDIFGFTLIEFVIVMTIGAILSGMIIPIGQKLVAKARTIKDINKVKQLALAYNIAFYEGLFHTEEAMKIGNKSIHYIAPLLAIAGGINDISFYRSEFSPHQPNQKIVNDTTYLATITQCDWEFAVGLPSDADPKTPILVSRGLQEDGSWENKPDSVYGKDGGIIAFLNGEVRYCQNASEVLVNYKTGQSTSNYEDAIPEDAQWVTYHPASVISYQLKLK